MSHTKAASAASSSSTGIHRYHRPDTMSDRGGGPSEFDRGSLCQKVVRFIDPFGSARPVRLCGNLLVAIAIATTIVFSILGMTNTLSTTTVGGTLLGCGTFTATHFIYRSYKEAQRKAQQNGSDSTLAQMDWMRVAFAIAISLPAIVAGALGLAGVASGATMGWIYFGSLLTFTGVALLSTCALGAKAAHIKNTIENAGTTIASDQTLNSFFSARADLKSRINVAKPSPETILEFVKELLKADADFQAIASSRGWNTWINGDNLELGDLATTYRDDSEFKRAIDAVLAKHPSVKSIFTAAVSGLSMQSMIMGGDSTASAVSGGSGHRSSAHTSRRPLPKGDPQNRRNNFDSKS